MNLQNPDIVYVNFYHPINQQRVSLTMNFFSNLLSNAKPKEVYFSFASPGGEVAAGLVLYNFLKAMPVELITHNIGSVDSIGNVIFLAGKKRYANRNSSFLFHGVKIGNVSPANLSTINELKSSLEVDQQKIAGVITDNTKLSTKEIDSLFQQGESKAPDFALDKGIIHEIKEFIIPKDKPIITIDFQGQ